MTLVEELWDMRGRLEAELSRLLWPSSGGLPEVLDRAELLLPPGPDALAPLELPEREDEHGGDRKSTRLNSSH